ncbi:MAG: GNAT family N-acetyltransferase, partial [Betaproteobacteria bacterium]|nr:GNAT family N-acetyltransferase [Betaproteobacteria bacterium]
MVFSVRPDKRGRKIGTKLMQRLLLRARMCGTEKVFVLFLSDNPRAIQSSGSCALTRPRGAVAIRPSGNPLECCAISIWRNCGARTMSKGSRTDRGKEERVVPLTKTQCAKLERK